MNKGIHWEWRAFGILSKEHRTHIERTCSAPLKSNGVTDKYLWRAAGCKANVKIRRKKLKFKRLLEEIAGEGFELWEEGKHLEYKFPLDRSVMDLLESYLSAKPPKTIRSVCNNIDELTNAVSLFEPIIKLIEIKKYRSRHLVMFENIPMQLEITDILSPIELTSIAIECNFFKETDRKSGLYYMRGARDLLKLPGSLQIMGYVQFMDDLVMRGFFN